MSTSFEALLAVLVDRGFDRALLRPGRAVEADDVPASVAATYAVADGLDLVSWRARYDGRAPELMMMAELLGEERSRAYAAMKGGYARRFGEADPYWEDSWWPLLTSSPKDVVAVDRITGAVWFSYNEARIKEVIAPSLEEYWTGCARWAQNIRFDPVDGLWDPVVGYRGCEGPWDPNALGTGSTTTPFPSVGA
ncbi:hypothetical protein [Cumulibacter manganitolerans]|uniref:hypothetical protein n=1 Tax=Cumulibacter manganitolerans TaxID=1884992 RepID=UPI001295B2F3|nr:hypothetical protein [Cumulibacter manganitolerans]